MQAISMRVYNMIKCEWQILSLEEKVKFIKWMNSYVMIILKCKVKFLDSYVSGDPSNSHKCLAVQSLNKELSILMLEWFKL